MENNTLHNNQKSSRYSEAGVDIDKGNAFVESIKDTVASTHNTQMNHRVMEGLGGFASHVALDLTGYHNPVLVNATDGVGTKLAIAALCKKHDTIGIDLVAMCVNDLIVGGATPITFLDYFATGKLDTVTAQEVVKGIAEGCRQAGCALVGGETAEMPNLYANGDYDLAGFVSGLVDRDKIIDGSNIAVGNSIIGIASSGLHSNGYSLVRKICFADHNFTIHDTPKELNSTLGEELLRPTKIYVQSVLNILKKHKILGMVHNTGGGFVDNIPRILPNGTKALLNKKSWTVPPIFSFLQKYGEIPEEEMYRTFNMGIGLLVIVDKKEAQDICTAFEKEGERAIIIGEITALKDGEQPVNL